MTAHPEPEERPAWRAERVIWDQAREDRIRRALSILGATRSIFTRDDMRAAVDEIDRLAIAAREAESLIAEIHALSVPMRRHPEDTPR